MRTALSRLQRGLQPQYLTGKQSQQWPCVSNFNAICPPFTRQQWRPSPSYGRSHTNQSRSPDSDTPPGFIPFLDARFQTRVDAGIKGVPKANVQVIAERRRDPSAWIELLDQFVPEALQSKPGQYDGRESPLAIGGDKDACEYILEVLDTARDRQHAGVEILAYMIIHGQREAALYIIKLLLDNLTSRFPSRSQDSLPSNIQWPGHSLLDTCKAPINAVALSGRSNSHAAFWDHSLEDPRYTFILSETKETTMTQIWATLGSLVISSADLPEERASDVNNALLLLLGQIHNLDLVPENVYTYQRSTLPTTVQRPPILHLVSSRILTALSDAAWRQQQDLMIQRAASHGVPYEEIGRDPPGGRFRLKVRPLSPEIWLEFILWCCVEGGFTSAGVRVLRYLSAQTDNPWFSMTWSPMASNGQSGPVIDWQRVRARYGGSVGMNEGYSRDKPFVEMPSRTISTEVVLGLVDASINTVNNEVAQGSGVEVVQRKILAMINFLEPHDVPTSYFNYLAIRLMQTDVFDLPANGYALQMWYKRLTKMKTLESSRRRLQLTASFDLESLSAHSETHAGILQQALDSYVQSGDIHRALDAFNNLQELVDDSKLQAIGSFLNDPTVKAQPGYFFGKPQQRQDFVGSHGQLPMYKLTGLLDLTTDTGLTGFGQWLLYNEDPDGPLIPESAYENPGLARPLIRFASLDNDDSLVEKVLQAQKRSARRPTKALLRALINTDIVTLHFRHAAIQLNNLTFARGGGFGLSNFAYLAGVIFKIEKDFYDMTREKKALVLNQARNLLKLMLAGSLNDRSGTFTLSARRYFRQQVGALLRGFQSFPQSSLSHISAEHMNKYPSPNRPCLSPTIFNIFLEAIIDCEGASAGVRLWEQLCHTSDVSGHPQEDGILVDDDFIAPDGTAEGADSWEDTQDAASNMAADDEPASMQDTQEIEPGEQQRLPYDEPESVQFSSGFFPEGAGSDIETVKDLTEALNPIVIPDQRTLRLIVRSAVRERRRLSGGYGNDLSPKEILDWAAEVLSKFFGATKKMISMELEEPLKQTQIRQLDNKLSHVKSRGKSLDKAPQVVRRVAAMFKGQERARGLRK